MFTEISAGERATLLIPLPSLEMTSTGYAEEPAKPTEDEQRKTKQITSEKILRTTSPLFYAKSDSDHYDVGTRLVFTRTQKNNEGSHLGTPRGYRTECFFGEIMKNLRLRFSSSPG